MQICCGRVRVFSSGTGAPADVYRPVKPVLELEVLSRFGEMSGTLLEQTRAAHEEIERLERCIVQELQRETKSHKERLHQNHRVNNMRHAILEATARLVRPSFPSPLLLFPSLLAMLNNAMQTLNCIPLLLL